MSFNHASIGIDLGSSKFVIAVAKKGGVEILTNDASYRQTPTLVSYGPERIAGDKAVQKIKKNINNSVFLPTRFLGEVSNEQMKLEQPFLFSKVHLNEQHHPIFSLNYEAEQININAEQLLAGVFNEAISVLKLNNIDQKEAVVSVPSFFNQVERQAVIDAAKIAGLEITKLYNESAANVMNYGIFRMGDLDPKNPRLVGFVDMGHSKTSIFFANIWKDKADILFETSDPNLGTRNLDLMMLSHYTHAFEQKHRINLNESPKSVFRLLEAIERQRKILTANPEAVLSVECIYEDIDFSHLLTREEFEAINQKVIQQLATLMNDVLKQLSPEVRQTLHSVERVGGGTRIPFVEKIIASTFGFEQVSKTLDANESVSRGCAIQAAMLSPLFKVPQFSIVEKLVSPVFIKLQYEGEEEKKKELFKVGAEFNKNLSIGVKQKAALKVSLAIHSRNSGREVMLCNASLDKIVSKEERFEGKVYFLLDRNGIAQIEKCELRETYIVEEKIPVKTSVTDKSKETPKSTVDGKMEIETPESAKEEFTIEKKEKTRISNLDFKNKSNFGLERTQIETFKQFESRVSAKEQLFKETQTAKYNLESFIYDTRNKVNDSKFQNLVSQTEKSAILHDLEVAENWLYAEGTNTTKQEYEAHAAQTRSVALCFTSRLTKTDQARSYAEEAIAAFRDFEKKNEELLKHGSPVQLNELTQKVKEGSAILGEFQFLNSNFSTQTIDNFNFEDKKSATNKIYEAMNNVLAIIKREKEQRESEEKKKAEDLKKKNEEEAKKKADEEKKKLEEEKKKAQATVSENTNSKMDIEK